MKRTVLLIVGIALLLGAGAYAIKSSSDNQQGTDSPNSEINQEEQKSMEYQKITSQVKSGEAILVDVRTASEFAEGHAQPAVNLSLQDLQSGMELDFAKDKKVYVYCRSGARASEAQKILEQAGFSDVENLGGLSDMQNLGFDLVQ